MLIFFAYFNPYHLFQANTTHLPILPLLFDSWYSFSTISHLLSAYITLSLVLLTYCSFWPVFKHPSLFSLFFPCCLIFSTFLGVYNRFHHQYLSINHPNTFLPHVLACRHRLSTAFGDSLHHQHRLTFLIIFTLGILSTYSGSCCYLHLRYTRSSALTESFLQHIQPPGTPPSFFMESIATTPTMNLIWTINNTPSITMVHICSLTPSPNWSFISSFIHTLLSWSKVFARILSIRFTHPYFSLDPHTYTPFAVYTPIFFLGFTHPHPFLS